MMDNYNDTGSVTKQGKASLGVIILMAMCIAAAIVSVAYYAMEYSGAVREYEIVQAQCRKIADNAADTAD